MTHHPIKEQKGRQPCGDQPLNDRRNVWLPESPSDLTQNYLRLNLGILQLFVVLKPEWTGKLLSHYWISGFKTQACLVDSWSTSPSVFGQIQLMNKQLLL